MIEDVLKKWNPWWIFDSVANSKKGIRRSELLDNLLKLLRVKEVIAITGVRRSGKSTLLFQIIDAIVQDVSSKNIFYFNFDEPLEEKGINAIDKVFNTYLEINNPKEIKYIFFDEIQNVQGWEKWIKKQYDLHGKELKFVVTGSNSTILSDKLSSLLTGRIFNTQVYPLSFKEFLNFNNVKIKDKSLQKEELKHYFSKYFDKGGFPEVVLEKSQDINRRRLKEYYDGILLRDVIVNKKIREIAKLNELSNFAMANISNLFSYNNISKTISLNIHTLKEYLEYLENAYLIFQVNYFSYSMKETILQQKPRKIYCIDNAMRNSVAFMFSRDKGRIAENFVFLELKRTQKEIYYWKGKEEVDFVLKNLDNTLEAINVTYSDEIHPRETKALIEFKEQFKKTKKLTLITKDTEKKEKQGKHTIHYTPLWKWLLK